LENGTPVRYGRFLRVGNFLEPPLFPHDEILRMNFSADGPGTKNTGGDLLLADDAPQFKKITAELALCWIHEGRHYNRSLQC
jgi:hypothetical protein